MDILPRALAWAGGLLALGLADLVAVGGAFDQADLLLMGLGAVPVAAFAWFVVASRTPEDN